MTTPKRKLPDHITWALEEAESQQARITRLLQEIHRVMTDQRGINKYALDALHARVSESAALLGQALHSIERREPEPDNGNGTRPIIDRAWLEAMDRLTQQGQNGVSETIRAFINAKLQEFD